MNSFLTQLILDLEDVISDIQADFGYDSVAENKLDDLIEQIKEKQDAV